MKTIIAICVAGLVIGCYSSFAEDNVFGDYLMGTMQKEVSLDLEGAALVDVLKMLSQQTNLNFVSTEAIQERKLTLYMEKVPLKEAMDVIFKANHLAYDYYPDSKIFVIKEMGRPELEVQTKVYHLRYVRVGSSRMTQEIEDLMDPQNASSGSTQNRSQSKEGIRNAIESVLTKAGKVSEDPITNSLIVSDVPTQFPRIDEVVNKLDIPTPKVMIEVEMLDVSKSHLDQLGFNWANGAWARVAGPARSTRFPFDGTLLNDHRQSYAAQSSMAGVMTPPVLGIIDFTNLSVIMQFLTQDTSTKFLARPKILTLSNETAEVNLIVNEAIGVETVTSEAGYVNQNIEREETGTRLRVTPQVNPNTQEVTLFLEIFNRESSNSGISTTILTGDSEIKNVEERGTRSTVRLKNGETLYIGGLIRREQSETVTKIPVLGDIPLLGNLFKYTSRPGGSNLDRELLVFLTPRIVEERPVVSVQSDVMLREQQDVSKRQSVALALDSFTR